MLLSMVFIYFFLFGEMHLFFSFFMAASIFDRGIFLSWFFPVINLCCKKNVTLVLHLVSELIRVNMNSFQLSVGVRSHLYDVPSLIDVCT